MNHANSSSDVTFSCYNYPDLEDSRLRLEGEDEHHGPYPSKHFSVCSSKTFIKYGDVIAFLEG